MLTELDKDWIVEAIEKGTTKTSLDIVNQVVIPAMDNMYGKINNDIKALQTDVSQLQADTSRIDRKLTVISDHQANKLDNHEKRIGKLEFHLA